MAESRINSTGPCSWPDFTALCCDDWDNFSASVQEQATTYAEMVLWAATGRQFGTCELTVRPCGRQCADCPSGWYWGDGTWYPYIAAGGVWKNCWCGNMGDCCTCDPDCQVYLPGPVESIVSVQVGGESLSVSGGHFFVLDQQWLIRTDTEACWPLCADQNLAPDSADAFEVTYNRGKPVPAALVNATASLACEYAKACIGAECRLPMRISSITRQGVSVQFVDIQQLLSNGLTGLWEVDQVILALNPYGLKGRTRFYSPDVPQPRQVTWG